MKNLTCVWRNIYNTARATHSRYYKHFAKHACDFSLQSVSANFTRSSSELYSEIDKWAGNFVISFRSSEAISELRFEIRKFKLRVYQETSKMSEKKPDDELLNY